MNLYPSISSQVSPELEGVLYIDVGAYFEPYESSDEVELDTSEREQE